MARVTQNVRDRRLTRAIEELSKPVRELPVDRFTMCTFGDKHFYAGNGRHCGTAACAAGTLSLIPYFRRGGFESEWLGEEGREYLEPARNEGGWRPTWGRLGADYFGISTWEADQLWKSRELTGDGWDERDATKRDAVRRFVKLREKYRQGEGDMQQA